LTGPLLNDDQRRRLATHLRLLVQDLDGLAQSPQLSPPGDPYDPIRVLVAQAGLAQRLDPGVERLRALLTELARVADRLPDG
jgi:hypothetical protein